MVSALLSTIVGVVLTSFLATKYFGFGPRDIIQSILVSEWAGLSSLVITLQAERMPKIKKHLLNRSLKTWGLISVLYIGQMLLLAPMLREGWTYPVLFLPLLLCTGLTILAFGPIQDWMVRRSQRKALGLRDGPFYKSR